MATAHVKGFSRSGKAMWDSWGGPQKDLWLKREMIRRDMGYLTKRERDILEFLTEEREKEKMEYINPKKTDEKYYLKLFGRLVRVPKLLFDIFGRDHVREPIHA